MKMEDWNTPEQFELNDRELINSEMENDFEKKKLET